jgi:hypothetical protein
MYLLSIYYFWFPYYTFANLFITGDAMVKNLIRLSKIKPGQLPLEKSTLYKHHHLKKFPRLFVKLGGALFVDLTVLEEIIEAGRGG